MATNATWTVVFEDKMIIKQSGDAAGTFYIIDDNAFWDREDYSTHLAKLQSDWDNDNIEGESEADKISRLGARPTSYTS